MSDSRLTQVTRSGQAALGGLTGLSTTHFGLTPAGQTVEGGQTGPTALDFDEEKRGLLVHNAPQQAA